MRSDLTTASGIVRGCLMGAGMWVMVVSSMWGVL